MTREGGLAEVTIRQTGEERRALKIGNVRIFDLVGSGPEMVLECKGSGRDPVKADPRKMLQMMSVIMERLGNRPA